jgi:hypothetical protein
MPVVPRGLAGGRLRDRGWNNLWELYSRTDNIDGTWMGFSWPHDHPVRCELQRDTGYDGAIVRLEVPEELAEQVRQTARDLGGGVGA